MNDTPKSNLRLHAERELELMGYAPLNQPQEDAPNKWIQENVLELLDVFSKQGHSGFSAPFCIDLFNRLAKYELLAPLTGADDEWHELGNGVFQNKRCSHVFKDKEVFDGQAYDIEGKIFMEPDGSCYTSYESRVPIIFPYTPTRQYIQVPAETEH